MQESKNKEYLKGEKREEQSASRFYEVGDRHTWRHDGSPVKLSRETAAIDGVWIVYEQADRFRGRVTARRTRLLDGPLSCLIDIESLTQDSHVPAEMSSLNLTPVIHQPLRIASVRWGKPWGSRSIRRSR